MKKFLIIAVVLSSLGYVLHAQILTAIGSWLVHDTTPKRGDAAVVLTTGAEYYERLLHAAYLYRSMVVDSIVINGNRKKRYCARSRPTATRAAAHGMRKRCGFSNSTECPAKAW
ncbi:MAG: hypothetical protein JKP90_03545 [Desulfofustis sp. PB-SRB1]|nr:hypothetical protein [Desulfofustis sp. PB-SRB1]